jgi:hypothetical protein
MLEKAETERAATLAKAAGLDRAWQDHRADVEEAIALAARFRDAFARPASPAAEPMPSYRAPVRGAA